MAVTDSDMQETDELVALVDTLRDMNEMCDRVLNQTYNQTSGFIVVVRRQGRNTSLYQVMANVQRNLSLSIEGVQTRLAELSVQTEE